MMATLLMASFVLAGIRPFLVRLPVNKLPNVDFPTGATTGVVRRQLLKKKFLDHSMRLICKCICGYQRFCH
jgi:hypothetical protein